MNKEKATISGRYVAPNTIEVDVSGLKKKLIDGQRVLVYVRTGKDIMTASGKSLGKKEIILGTGRVDVKGPKMNVIVAVPKASNLEIKRGQALRKSRNHTMKAHSKGKKYTYKGNNVLIKPIEE